MARYGDRIHALPREEGSQRAYDEYEISDYEFEGLRFVAKFRVDRDIDALGEVVLALSSSGDRPSLLPEFERLVGAITKTAGAISARYDADTRHPATITRGVIWSGGSPWVLLRYEYVEGALNSITIHLQQTSRRTLLSRNIEPLPLKLG